MEVLLIFKLTLKSLQLGVDICHFVGVFVFECKVRTHYFLQFNYGIETQRVLMWVMSLHKGYIHLLTPLYIAIRLPNLLRFFVTIFSLYFKTYYFFALRFYKVFAVILLNLNILLFLVILHFRFTEAWGLIMLHYLIAFGVGIWIGLLLLLATSLFWSICLII